MIFCENVWQGPSDDRCEDDLLVVGCTEPAGHRDLHHGIILGPGGAEVMWAKGTETLWRVRDGSVYRKQFATGGGES